MNDWIIRSTGFCAVIWIIQILQINGQSPLLKVDNATVIENNPITLTCILHNDVTQVSWWRNGVSAGIWTGLFSGICQSSPSPLPDGFSFSCLNNTAFTLTVKHLLRTQDGEFWNCAVNFIGETVSYSNSISFRVIVPIKTLTMSPVEDPISLIAGQPVQFTCTSDFGRPNPSMNWYKHRSGSNPSQDINITSSSSTITSNQSITISTLTFTPTKSDHNLRLYCTGNNGGQTVTSHVKPLLNVLSGPNTPEFFSNGSALIGSMYIFSGKLLTIQCVSSGNPPPTYVWTYPGGSATGADLVVLNIQPAHEGNFTCTARNTMSASTGITISEQKTATVIVSVFVPITYVSMVGELVAIMKEQESRYIVCEASPGKPIATMKWYKDNGTPQSTIDDIPFPSVSYTTTTMADTSVRSVLNYTGQRSDNGMRIYCVGNNVGEDLISPTKTQLVISAPPEIPGSLEVSEVGINNGKLCWRYRVDDNIYTRFILEVKRQNSNSQWMEHQVSDIHISSISSICTFIRSLDPSTQYSVRMYAENILGKSGYSNTATLTTLTLPTPVPTTTIPVASGCTSGKRGVCLFTMIITVIIGMSVKSVNRRM